MTASDIHNLDDSDDDYYGFAEDDTPVSQSQLHHGISQSQNVFVLLYFIVYLTIYFVQYLFHFLFIFGVDTCLCAVHF